MRGNVLLLSLLLLLPFTSIVILHNHTNASMLPGSVQSIMPFKPELSEAPVSGEFGHSGTIKAQQTEYIVDHNLHITTYTPWIGLVVRVRATIYVDSGGTLELKYSEIIFEAGVSIIVNSGGNLTIVQSTVKPSSDGIYYNITVNSGGVVKIVSSMIEKAGKPQTPPYGAFDYGVKILGATYYIKDTLFDYCYWTLYIQGGSGVIDNVQIISFYGPAIFFDSVSTATVEDVRINGTARLKIVGSSLSISNLMLGNMSRIYIESSTVDIMNLRLYQGPDSAIAAYDSNLTLTDVHCEFNGTNGLYAFGSKVVVNDALFIQRAVSGTAISIEDSSELYLTNVEIRSYSPQGYAIFAKNTTQVSLSNVKINSTGSIAVYAELCSVTISDTEIYGGGIYAVSSYLSTNTLFIAGPSSFGIKLENCNGASLKDVRIDSSGGDGILVIGCSGTIKMENVGVIRASGDGVRITDSTATIVFNKSAVAMCSGTGLTAENVSTIVINGSLFYANDLGVSFSLVGEGNVTVSDFIDNAQPPQLVDDGPDLNHGGKYFYNYCHWSDYTGAGYYTIDNDSYDYNPRTFPLDQNPPTISVTAPANGSTINSRTVQISWTASDDLGIKNFYIVVNGTWMAVGYKFSYEVEVPDEWVNLTVVAVDWSGNMASDTVLVYVRGPPSVTILSPVNGSVVTVFPCPVVIEYKDNSIVASAHVYVNGIGKASVEINAKEGKSTIYVTIQDGDVALKVVVYDGIGESAYDIVNIIVRARPKITILSPKDGALLNTTVVTIRWNATDNTNLKGYDIYVDDIKTYNTSDPTETSYTLSLPSGYHKIKVIAYDIEGLPSWDEVVIAVDTDPPEITFVEPPPGTATFSTENSTVTFVWNVSDGIAGIAEVKAIFDDVEHILSVPDEKHSQFSITFTGLVDGSHNLTVIAIDKLGNMDKYTVIITVREPPKVEILSPANGSVLRDPDPVISWRASDNTGIKYYELYISGLTLMGQSWINVSEWVGNGPEVSIRVSQIYGHPLGDLNYTIIIRAHDVAGNTGSAMIKITISAPPELHIGFEHPSHGLVTYNGCVAAVKDLTIRIDARGNEDNVTAIWVSMDGKEWIALDFMPFEYVPISYTFKNVTEGRHLIIVRAIDSNGNVAQASILVIVDRTPPDVRPTVPEVIYTSADSVQISWTASDENGIVRYRIFVNGTLEYTLSSEVTTAALILRSGIWEVAIEAMDSAGNIAMTTVYVYVDRSPPSVKIIQPKLDSIVQPGYITVIWEAKDNFGIAKVEIYLDWKLVAVVEGSADRTTIYVPEGAHHLLVKVFDKAGNHAYDFVYFAASGKGVLQASSVSYAFAASTALVVSVLLIKWLVVQRPRPEGIKETSEIEESGQQEEAEGEDSTEEAI